MIYSPREVALGLANSIGFSEDTVRKIEAVLSEPRFRAALAPVREDPDRAAELLRQEGLTHEEESRLHLKELSYPAIQSALHAQDQAVLQLAREVQEKGLRFSPAQYEERHRALRLLWNAAVANTKTIYRYCELCGLPAVLRSRQSSHCSDECARRAKARRANRRRK